MNPEVTQCLLIPASSTQDVSDHAFGGDHCIIQFSLTMIILFIGLGSTHLQNVQNLPSITLTAAYQQAAACVGPFIRSRL